MRIIRFHGEDGKVCLARDLGDGTVERLNGRIFDQNSPIVPSGEILAVPDHLLAPLVPTNIFCIGLNYAKHAKEGGREVPPRPLIFMKPTSSLNHPGQPIRIPDCEMEGPETDYECELVVVIGQPARNVLEEDALKFVFGYTCGNDVSARQWQRVGGNGQWIRGKGFDTFCPMGSALLTADEIPDPQSLSIRTILNGQVMQQDHTSNMIFSVRRLISFMSQDTTLLPGTVIFTGTPEGVGFARKPPVWLKSGDEVTIEIEKIGRLTNPVQ